MLPINRLPVSFRQPEPEPPPRPPRLSVADKLLRGAWSAKISLLKFDDDDGNDACSCEVEIKSTVDSSPDEVLAAILTEFRKPASGEGMVSQ